MWPNPQETADLATFTEEILNGCNCSDDFKLFSVFPQNYKKGVNRIYVKAFAITDVLCQNSNVD